MSFLSGDAPDINFTPTGFNAGGLNVSGTGDVTPTRARSSAVTGLSGEANQLGDIYGDLRPARRTRH